jgi:hypothetical protein
MSSFPSLSRAAARVSTTTTTTTTTTTMAAAVRRLSIPLPSGYRSLLDRPDRRALSGLIAAR